MATSTEWPEVLADAIDDMHGEYILGVSHSRTPCYTMSDRKASFIRISLAGILSVRRAAKQTPTF